VLSELQEKLAEAHALAIAAAAVTTLVADVTPDRELRLELERMRRDADETRARCLRLQRGFERELANELLAHVNSTKEKAGDLAGAWFKAGTGPLAAWSFLAMGEAGEVATWMGVRALAAKAEDMPIVALATWALPIQRAHYETALSGTVRLSELAEPARARWG